MEASLNKILNGYKLFREKYSNQDLSIMRYLSIYGQSPSIMIVACCDSRVDPALILQCDPGDLFVIRNVANIVPPYEKDESHHGTSAALEFGIRFLKVKHLILLGHSQCSGIKTAMQQNPQDNDFISNWVSLIKSEKDQFASLTSDDYSKISLDRSYNNCLQFPWIAKKVADNELRIHKWFFDIKTSQIYFYNEEDKKYSSLENVSINSSFNLD